MDELTYAFAGSLRSWPQAWARHIADYGPGRLVQAVAERKALLDQPYRILVVDADSPLVDPAAVEQLHRRGRAVIAVWEPADPRTKQLGLRLGADALIEADASALEFLRLALDVAGERPPPPGPLAPSACSRTDRAAGVGPPADGPPGPGFRVVVGGPATDPAIEVAVQLARAAASDARHVVLVDADEVHPGIAQRLGLPLLPNLHLAVEALGDPSFQLADALLGVPAGGFWALPGLADPAQWAELSPAQVVEVVDQLAAAADLVVAHTAPLAEDLAAHGADRFGITRRLLGAADVAVGVEVATPTGAARLLGWLAEARTVAPEVPVHLVLCAAPRQAVRRGQLEQALAAAADVSVSLLPADPRVETAAWDGALVPPGPFVDAVSDLATRVIPWGPRARRRRSRVRA